MLSSKVHSRHPTWPPSRQLLPDTITNKESIPRSLLNKDQRYIASLPDITEDEDPFSHFLSPVLEEESSFDETNYTAGITPYDSSTSSVSRRDAVFRARLEEKWETFVARRLLQHRRSNAISISSSSSSLRSSQAPSTPPSEDALPDLLDETMDCGFPGSPDSMPASPDQAQWYFPSTIDAEDEYDISDDSDGSDGWEADRRRLAVRDQRHDQLQQLSPRKKFGSSGRNLSGKKHAWREPSPGLWTVAEEDAEDLTNDGEGKRGRRGRKRAKTVHWNEEVTVLEYER